jgi:hypothetical protein
VALFAVLDFLGGGDVRARELVLGAGVVFDGFVELGLGGV